jgi:hypothetical protein
MKMSRMIFSLVCLVGITQVVWSQNEALGARKHGIPGFLDPKTGQFTTKVPSESQDTENPPSLNQYYGTIVIQFTVYIGSKFPPNTVIACGGSASTFDAGGGEFDEEGSSIAPTPSGGHTTCTVTIPYDWQLSQPTTDVISISLSAEAANVVTINGQPRIVSYRIASRFPPSITGVPTKDGTVTTLEYVTTI